MIHPAAFRVIGTENHAGNTKEGSCLGAHGAGFQGDRQGAIAKPRLAQMLRRCAQGEHFGMGRGVMAGFNLITRPRQHLAGLVGHHGAHRHLAAGSGGAGFFQSDFHGGHGAFLPCWAAPVQGASAIPFAPGLA